MKINNIYFIVLLLMSTSVYALDINLSKEFNIKDFNRVKLEHQKEYNKSVFKISPLLDKNIGIICEKLKSADEDYYFYIISEKNSSFKERQDNPKRKPKPSDFVYDLIKFDSDYGRYIDCKNAGIENPRPNNVKRLEIPYTGMRLSGRNPLIFIDVTKLFFEKNKGFDKFQYENINYNSHVNLGFLIDLYTLKTNRRKQMKELEIKNNEHIIKALQNATFQVNYNVCGTWAHTPSKIDRIVHLKKIGEYKSRGNKFNGIKYIPVKAEIKGKCVYGKPSSFAQNITKNNKDIPFSGLYDFIVYKNDYDVFVAKENRF